jgi:hypothetical protein
LVLVFVFSTFRCCFASRHLITTCETGLSRWYSMPKKTDYAALRKALDLQAAAAAAQPAAPAAQPAAPAGVPAPPDSADRAQTAEEAEFFKRWFDALFYENPSGAIKGFMDRVERGIESGDWTLEQALRFMRDPNFERSLETMLSLSVPGQPVFLEDLADFEPQTVIENYMQQCFRSANADLSRLAQFADLSLGGDAAPTPAPVRRASLLPSAALHPTSPSASLQAPTKRPGRAAFEAANTANQQRLANEEADAAGRPQAPLDADIVSRVNRRHWSALSKDAMGVWDR